ncbi:hypothetical protein CERSUDRAFT_98113 [Gelatoporia subvermispora B]|uniref:MYND-type domain-containing protein n=1 Tax=Ceriporiopsis subvermispora (strain B) TaxID=914234 RepID=M2PE89_CERS8|nr:hypothetical protein CERSUDRAFT_98113 [Gelatoporia subvermispora B]
MTRANESISHPYLPPQLLEELKKSPGRRYVNSYIHDAAAKQFRSDLNKNKVYLDSEVTLVPPSFVPESLRDTFSEDLTFGKGEKKTYLHLAAYFGDVPFTYECLRLGIKVDTKDAHGETPLLLACKRLVFHRCIYPYVDISSLSKDFGISVPTDTGGGSLLSYIVGEIASVAEILIAQHADVNIDLDGFSPLILACKAQYLPLVKLLLEHGANARIFPSADLSLFFLNRAERNQFRRLLEAHSTPTPRPPRPCPCWSGKPLQDCHAAEERPYPIEFLCPCASEKVYGACCRKRFYLGEVWNEEYQAIATTRLTATSETYIRDTALLPTFAQVTAYLKTNFACQPVYYPQLEAAFKQQKTAMARKLIDEKLADPAFVHAMQSLPFVALGFNRKYSKVFCKTLADKWNKAIDDYISRGSDTAGRPPKEIAMAAKVNENGGALYMRCEADGCTIRTDDNILRECSRCKGIYYCNADCQKAHWSQHRGRCKSSRVMPSEKYIQLLPSQLAVKEELVCVMEASLRRIRGMRHVSLAFAGSHMDVAGVFLSLDFQTGKDFANNPQM